MATQARTPGGTSAATWAGIGLVTVAVLGVGWLGVSALVGGPAHRERELARAAAHVPATAPTASTRTPRPQLAAGTTRYAARLAALISGLGERRGLRLVVRSDLQPHQGGDASTPAAVLRYRSAVRIAALAVSLDDAAARTAFAAAGKSGQADALQSWVELVRTLLPRARIALVVLDRGAAVARADLAPGAKQVRVTVTQAGP